MPLKDELVGHSTLGVLALMGMALYATTYALVYATSTSARVAVVDMWMTYTHMVCAGGSLAVQAIAASLMQRTIAHVADAQAAVFLGVALAVSVLGNACVQGECAMYFSAAAVPRLAAAGSVAWAWVMYAAAMGCWRDGITLGLAGRSPLTAATAMAFLPIATETKLMGTCSGWNLLLCDTAVVSGGVTVPRCGIDPIARLCVGGALLLLGLVLSWAPGKRAILRLLGAAVFVVQPFIMWSMQPAAPRVTASPPSYFVIMSLLGCIAFVSELRRPRIQSRDHAS
jgi:hypothetical protein